MDMHVYGLAEEGGLEVIQEAEDAGAVCQGGEMSTGETHAREAGRPLPLIPGEVEGVRYYRIVSWQSIE